LISFCIEIEPSVQVVWLWKSPLTYKPFAFGAGSAAFAVIAAIAATLSTAVTAVAIWLRVFIALICIEAPFKLSGVLGRLGA
jgi:hypothetical protein